MNEEQARQLLYTQGEANRRLVVGDAYVDAALAKGTTPFSGPAQEYITEAAWGSLWSREGLEKKYRSLVVISILATGGHLTELATHVRGGLRNGLTEVEIREALMHVLGYAGFPSGLQAFRAVQPVIDAWNAEVAAGDSGTQVGGVGVVDPRLED